MQIAKLFNRTLLLLDNDDTNDYDLQEKNAPKLYLKEEDINVDVNFALPAKVFMSDVLNESDRRVILCKQIIDIILIGLENVQLIVPDNKDVKGYFNLEYLKCILFDIFLSCAKFWLEGASFLSRIKKLKSLQKEYNDLLDNYSKAPDNNVDSLKSANRLRCKILLFRNDNNLIIINPVNRTGNLILDGWKERNEEIKMRYENPYDSFNGRMSLFTISNYISGNCDLKPEFEYVLYKKLPDEWKKILSEQFKDDLESESLWFVSKLPVLKGEI